MSQTGTDLHRGQPSARQTDKAPETRIDAPHPIKTAKVPPPMPAEALAAAADGEPAVETLPLAGEAVALQVRVQAAQLAEHLRARQKELDHREAELNARAAQLDRDARVARLWLEERMTEFDAQPPPVHEEIEAQRQAPRQQADALTARQQQLDDAEARLEGQRRAEIETLHVQWTADGARLLEESQTERDQLAAAHRRALAEVEEKRRTLELRNEQIDKSRSALDQLRADLARMHRETLEIRLATEELWAELSHDAPPAALTRSLGRIRTKLADHYRMANSELHQRKLELEQLRDQLAEQYQRLLKQKLQFEVWSGECREEVERQSQRLLARDHEIDRHAAELQEQTRQWQTERLECSRRCGGSARG